MDWIEGQSYSNFHFNLDMQWKKKQGLFLWFQQALAYREEKKERLLFLAYSILRELAFQNRLSWLPFFWLTLPSSNCLHLLILERFLGFLRREDGLKLDGFQYPIYMEQNRKEAKECYSTWKKGRVLLAYPLTCFIPSLLPSTLPLRKGFSSLSQYEKLDG